MTGSLSFSFLYEEETTEKGTTRGEKKYQNTVVQYRIQRHVHLIFLRVDPKSSGHKRVGVKERRITTRREKISPLDWSVSI